MNEGGAPPTLVESTYSVPTDSQDSEFNALPEVVRTVLGRPYNNVASFETTQIQGGITNRLYRLEPVAFVRAEDGGDDALRSLPPGVIVRVYGDNTELLIDRQKDIENFVALSQQKFGVKLLGLFKNGRIEEYFNDSITLAPSDLCKPHLTDLIAKELCKMHLLNVVKTSEGTEKKEPILFKTLEKWISLAESIDWGGDMDKKERVEKINLGSVREEIVWLKNLLKQTESPIVFAHNDLLSGNILYREGDGNLVFVDYEYGGWNYRGFDIGNHFCEYAGFDYTKFAEVYPNKETQMKFLSAYAKEEMKLRQSEYSDPGSPEFFEKLERLYLEVNRYALGSHLFWGVWGIIQAKHSKIDFDFLKYGEERIAAFYYSKESLIKNGLASV